jgi:hypothetical protein
MSLVSNVTDLATAVATAVKQNRVWINGNAADLTALNTTATTNLVAAINEVQAAVAGSSGIDDETTGTSTTWSSTKITAEVGAATAALVDSAPGTLDTLNELAAALGDDASFATTTSTALGNRVRTDTAAQGLNSTQQGNARTNIAAASAADLATLTTNVGDTTTNFVTTFEAGLLP